MNILVTGANGYIGRYVVDTLLFLGHKVLACDINTQFINPKASIFNASIFDMSESEIYCAFHQCDVCIHLAWRDGFVHDSINHILDLPKHYLFLKTLVSCGIQNIAVMGTMHEIGFYEGKVDENTPCNPTTNYGIAKNALRQLVFALDKSINVFWLRAFYIMGDDSNNRSVFSKLLEADKQGKLVFPLTWGNNKFDFIDVQTLAKYISLASTQQKITGIINLCSGVPVALRDEILSFIEKHNLKIQARFGEYPERKSESKIIYGDTSKINKIIENLSRQSV